jgi:V/A-type H+-transporting ATPase subunit K
MRNGIKIVLMMPVFIAMLSFAFVATFGQAPSSPRATGTFDLLSAALAVGLCGIGAGLAIFGSTSAGAAAMAEKPELATWILIFAGLGEGIAIYGLVIAILILGRS